MTDFGDVSHYLYASGGTPPLYEHDCNRCFYLGVMNQQDLYYRPGAEKTVIARRSSEASDYVSGIELAPHVPELQKALELAKQYGLA